MHNADSRLDFIHILPSSASRARGFYLKVRRVYLDLGALVDREYGHRSRRGMYAARFFGRGNTLHSVHSRFEAKFPVDVLARYFELRLLVAAECRA